MSSLQGLCCTKCQVVLAIWNNGVCTGPRGARKKRAEKKLSEQRSGKGPSPFGCAAVPVRPSRRCRAPRRALGLPSHSRTRPRSWTAEVSLFGPAIGLAGDTWGGLRESGVVMGRRVRREGWGRGEQEWDEGREGEQEGLVGPRLLMVRGSSVNFVVICR